MYSVRNTFRPKHASFEVHSVRNSQHPKYPRSEVHFVRGTDRRKYIPSETHSVRNTFRPKYILSEVHSFISKNVFRKYRSSGGVCLRRNVLRTKSTSPGVCSAVVFAMAPSLTSKPFRFFCWFVLWLYFSCGWIMRGEKHVSDVLKGLYEKKRFVAATDTTVTTLASLGMSQPLVLFNHQPSKHLVFTCWDGVATQVFATHVMISIGFCLPAWWSQPSRWDENY